MGIKSKLKTTQIGKVLTNFGYNLSYQILSLLLPIITVPYITKRISQDLIGINSICQAICSYFVMVGILGIQTFGTREIAKYQHDPDKRTEVFWKIYRIQFFAHLAVLGPYLIYSLAISAHKELMLVYISFIISSQFDISWLFLGVENFKDVSIRNLFVKLISFGLLFAVVKSDQDIYIYVLTIYVPQIVINIYMWIKSRKIIRISRAVMGYAPDKAVFIGTLSLFIPQVASSIYTILDKTVLGIFSTYSIVATYEQAQILLRLFLAVVPSFSKVMMPRIANSLHEDSEENTTKLMKFSSKLVGFITCGIFFGVLACADIFVEWYLPAGYWGASEIIRICSPIILFVSGSNLISIQYLIPAGLQKIYTNSICIAAGINILLNFILCPIIGVYGVCLSSVVAEGIGFAIQLYYFSKKMKLKTIFQGLPLYFISGFIMFGVLMIIRRPMNSSLQNIMILVAAGIAIYTGLAGGALLFERRKRTRLNG